MPEPSSNFQRAARPDEAGVSGAGWAAAAVTVTATLAEAVAWPPLAETVTFRKPAAAELEAESVTVVEQLAMHEDGEKLAVTPAGVDAENVTACAAPETSVAVMVAFAVEPCCTVTAEGDADSENPNGAGALAVVNVKF